MARRPTHRATTVLGERPTGSAVARPSGERGRLRVSIPDMVHLLGPVRGSLAGCGGPVVGEEQLLQGRLTADQMANAGGGEDLEQRLDRAAHLAPDQVAVDLRSEERRVGKECRSRWSPYH